jgi:uncharacterized protein (TIGR00255 family)
MTAGQPLQSMTGYGTASRDSERLQASASARSLNHRYLDLTVHLARRLMPLEGEVKRLVQARVQRGKVEVSVQASFRDDDGAVVVAARPLVAGLVRALKEAQAEHGLAGEVQVGDVARFPGAFEVIETRGLDDPRRREVLEVVAEALDGLVAMRRSEGAHLRAVLAEVLDVVEAAAGRLEELSASERETRAAGLLEKARGFARDLGLEEARLYQEVVRLADRQDVAEELERLRGHVVQAREALAGAGPCGKRLDFLAQEMAREANTVGSKSASTAMAREVVGLKGEVERFREQVQNLE